MRVRLDLDGTAQCQVNTGVPLLDHMLHPLASHGLLDLEICAVGDRRGIHRFGHFAAPLDEALVEVVLDCSGRPHLSCSLKTPDPPEYAQDT